MRSFAWALGSKSLRQNPRRNLTTGFALAIAYIAILFVLGYGNRMLDYLGLATVYLQHSGHIAIFAEDGLRRHQVKPSAYSLTVAQQKALADITQSMADVDFAAPYLLTRGLIGNGCASYPFVGRGLDPLVYQKMLAHPKIKEVMPEFQIVQKGQALWEAREIAQVSLARGLSERLGKGLKGDTGDHVQLISPDECTGPRSRELLKMDASVQLVGRAFDSRTTAGEASVTGVFSTGLSITESTSLTAPLAFIQDLVGTDKISYLAVFLKDARKAEDVSRAITNRMKELSLPVDAFAFIDKRLNPSYVQAFSVMRFTVGFVTIIVVSVALLSILNTLSISLAEARTQIGTLLALGFRPSDIALVFGVETLLTSAMAVVFGSLGSIGICRFVNGLAIPMQSPGFANATTFQVYPTLMNYIVVGLALASLVVVATWALARRYARRPLLELLDRGS